MHRIHSYPAKFPSLLVEKAILYSKEQGILLNTISDVFCGCGTTALEAKRYNLDFIGFDINPVATLIAKVKSEQYSPNILKKYFIQINGYYETYLSKKRQSRIQNDRIQYWFGEKETIGLEMLLEAIISCVPKGKYRNFFLVGFSNILKKVSRWLMKSIKPQRDPTKKSTDILEAFSFQFEMMFKANEESRNNFKSISKCNIQTKNFLDFSSKSSFVDLVITSPPYVTSYEYADLHQLSTLWLGYTNNYQSLRKGTIGSLYHYENIDKSINSIPKLGKETYEKMNEVDRRKAKSIGKYFIDINKAVKNIYSMINDNGAAIIVIGNTEYNGLKIDNAKYLVHSMIKEGFKDIEIMKRKISSKILSPYRDKHGKFSNNPNDKKVYSHEFIIFGKK